ncbi:hypothetical protein E3T55_19315 [Cryobacterium frigoriphilum]|uniref:PLL-like beta propeller domain-containing protein n=1 Tax=Cryobacterium frigoriphilum TaxID=1259150 RepID=A0A4V3IQE6_9MICO|nr:hypothetical protein [Cryobacterium frigoriphilum]TFD45172.1 hypothetical protein E3T55_19315 [Cryobacterium frigoriphilum]
MTWNSWFSHGAPTAGFTGGPSIVSRNNAVCNIYVRGGDNALWQKAFFNGAWHPWGRHNDGAVLASEPALGSMGPNHEHIFVRGTDGAVWSKAWNGAGGWSGWFSHAAPVAGLTGGPAIVSRNNTVCNIYVRGGDNALWQRAFFNGSWHPWGRHNDGAVLASEPALGSMGANHEHVFVRGTDGAVWSKAWNGAGGWSGWFSHGAPAGGMIGGPTIVSRNSGVCNIYVRGTDNALWQKAYFDGSWHAWGRHDDGAVLASEPALGSMGPSHEHVFVRGTDSAVWSKAWSLVPTVILHLKVLTNPTSFTVDQMVASMRDVYASRGINVAVGSRETLDLPLLTDVDVSTCIMGTTTAEQNQLFANRNGVGANHVVAYFVRSTNPPGNGCAAHPAGRPGCVVSSTSSSWTLGHEIGHVLGLPHVSPSDRLMMGNGTWNITNPPPDLIDTERATMDTSPLTVNI